MRLFETGIIMKNCFLQPRTAQSSRRGFTLIEILVTIGIIILLAGLTFPVFSRVREGGRRTSCSNNLRQLGLAFRQYVQDNSGRYPLTGAFTLWGTGGHWVAGTNGKNIASLSTFKPEPDGCGVGTCNTADVEKGAIYPYVKEASIFVCPSNQEGALKRLSYSMNCALGAIGDVRIKTPSEIVLLVDEDQANDGFFFATGDPSNTAAYPYGVKDNGQSTDKLTELHNGGGNLLFADGHVDFQVFKAFPLDKSAEGWANKSKNTGTPRFHDPAFGPYGSFVPVSTVKNDSCGVNLAAP